MIDNCIFIINPNSAKGKYDGFVASLQKLHPNAKYFVSESKEHTTEIIQTHFESTDIFVAAGGDGTISSIAEHLINSDKILAVYPMGSGNGFARENEFTKDIEDLLAKIKVGKSMKIDTVKIDSHISLNVSGVGFDSIVADSFEGTNRGFLNYIKTTIGTYFKYEGIEVSFKTEELKKYNGSYLMLNIANTRQFGNNAYIAPQADMADGLAELVLVKHFPNTHIPIFAKQLFSKELHLNPYVEFIPFKELELEVNQDIWHIDGDVQKINSPVQLKVQPASLNILI